MAQNLVVPIQIAVYHTSKSNKQIPSTVSKNILPDHLK